MTPEATWNLISNMAANFKQFCTRGDFLAKRVNEVISSFLEHEVHKLTYLMYAIICSNV